MFPPHPCVKVSIVGSLRDREVACSASDRQGSNFESCVWRTVSSQSSHHPQEVLLAQFSLYVHKGVLKPDSFHIIFSLSSKHRNASAIRHATWDDTTDATIAGLSTHHRWRHSHELYLTSFTYLNVRALKWSYNTVNESGATCILTQHMRRDDRRDARQKCNSFKKDRVAYRARAGRHASMLCQWWNSEFAKPTRRRAGRRVRVFYVLYVNPLSPHDALKHHFTSLKTDLIFPQLWALKWKFPWNWFITTWRFSLTYHSLQIIFIHYKSRIATAIHDL